MLENDMSVLERFSIGILVLFCFASIAAAQTAAPDLNEQLLAAARKGDAVEVKSLLEKGASVKAKTKYGATPLSYASDRGSVEVVKLLLERGADVNVKDSFYNATPILWAAMRNHAEVVKLLIAKGASKETAMEIAVSEGYLEVAKVVLDAGGLPPAALTGYLGSAIRSKNNEMVALLKAAGAQPPVAPDYKVDPSVLKTYEGTFKNDKVSFSFTVRDNKLMLITDSGDFEMQPSAKHTFLIPDINGTATFTLDAEKVTGVVFKRTGGGELALKKSEVQ
jgi:ankyrin repeat protein